MFKPDSMKEVNIFVLEKDTKSTVSILHDLELIQFFEVKEDGFENYEHYDLNEQSKTLLKTRSAITVLKEYYQKEGTILIDEPIDKTFQLKERLDKVEKELIKVKDDLKRLKILNGLDVKESELNNPNITIGFFPSGRNVIFKTLTKKNIKYRTYKTKSRIYFIAKTRDITTPFKEFYLPSNKNIDIEKKHELLKKQIEIIKKNLTKLSNNCLEDLRAKEHKLTKEIELLDAMPSFSKTQNISVINGYVPKRKIRSLESNLNGLLGDKYEIEIKDAKDDAPTHLTNPASISNFESLLRMYSLPKYKEFDPTILIFLVFPIFFGFILGDVIYGIIALIFFTYLKHKYKHIKEFISVLQLSAVSSIVFGFIYGEFIGYEFHGAFYGFFERSHHPETLLLFAIMFGVIHINLGLIIGFINNMKNLRHAIYDKLSWIILQIGVALIYFGTTGNNGITLSFGILITIISLILIYLGHGFIGIMEVPSFFTNILSYARLMAVGLSSIAIAVLINNYTAVFFAKGPLGIIAGILLFSAGHIFNIALGSFEGFLHTLRLHFVEFFTKFYSGGGTEFKPFGKREFIE